ncbi:MAG: hypothetical protein ABI467_07160 [Kofleriaceae bacterium]
MVTTPAWRRAAVVAALAVIVAAACWQRWHVLGATPFPVGIDGYFYPIEVRSLLEHGALRYPASPVTFYWMLPFAAATDPITGAKLAAALGTALIAVPAFGVGARLAGGSGSPTGTTGTTGAAGPTVGIVTTGAAGTTGTTGTTGATAPGIATGAGLIAAVLAATSASSGYLAIEFVKQGLGLTVALAALWAILCALDPPLGRPGRTPGGATAFAWRRVAIAGGAVVLVFATHKLAAGLVVLVAVPAVVVRVRHALRGRRRIYALLLGAGLGIAVAVAGVVAPQRFVSPHDLALLGGVLGTTAHPAAPALVMPGGGELVFDHEALLGGVVAVVALAVLLVDRRRARRASPARPARPVLDRHVRVLAYMIAGLGIALAIPWLAVTDPQGLGFRLRIAAFVPLALCAAICAGELARWVSRSAPRHAAPILAGLALAIAAVELPQDRHEGEERTHPALAAAVQAAAGHIPAGATVIVPERHILFMVDWYTRAPVRLRPEPVPYLHRVRLFGLVWIGGPGSPLARALDAARADPRVEPPLALHAADRNGLVLVTEPTWAWLLAHLPDRERAHFAAWPTL